MREQLDNNRVRDACDAIADSLSNVDSEGPLYLCVWGDGYTEPTNPIIGVHSFDFSPVRMGIPTGIGR